MRLSVMVASLALLFSQSTLAQYSSGGGGSSGGGASSGGSSSGSSGGGSHGGGGSSGGSSGGHVSGGGSGSHGSGSSGSTHVSTSSHAGSGFIHAPGKIDTLHGSVNEPSEHGESSEVHNQLLDQALAKLQYALPANYKNEEPFSAKSLKRIEPTSDRKAETNRQAKKEEPDGKPCHGHHCHPRPVTEYCRLGTNWRMSQDLYTTIQGDCENLAAKLAQEESRVAAHQAGQTSMCAMNPLGSACASATKTMNRLNAKISQLHVRYNECVLHDLRHKAAIAAPRK